MNKLALNKRSVSFIVLAGLAIFSLFLLPKPAQATPTNGLNAKVIASGELEEAIRTKIKYEDDGFNDGTDVKKVVMVEYTLAAGGTFGWHTHGGPVWAVVKSGTLSVYSGDDPTCTPEAYGPGEGFLDPGNHVHYGVNETNEPLVVYVTFMLPEDGVTRNDADNPGLCNP